MRFCACSMTNALAGDERAQSGMHGQDFAGTYEENHYRVADDPGAISSRATRCL